jgi:hypothetical protein
MKRKLITDKDYKPITGKKARGQFTEKNRKGIGQRPEFDRSQLNLFGLDYKDLPLDVFFSILTRPKNVKVFVKEREKGRAAKTGTRRSTIFSILALEEIVYNTAVAGCNTDLQCILHLLESDLVTKENYEDIYGALDKLITAVLYRQTAEDVKAEASKRSKFLDSMKKFEWYRPVMRLGLLKDKIFVMNEKLTTILQSERKEKQLVKLVNIVKIDDYTMLKAVNKLIKIVKGPKSSSQWLHAAVQLVQASVGSRWIEPLVVSKYELSTEPKYPADTYIVITGVAKKGSKALREFKKKLGTEMERSTGDESNNVLIDLVDSSQQDLLDILPDVVIVKPVLFSEYGINPAYIIDLVAQIRKFIGYETDRQLLSKKYLGKSIALFDSLWPKALLMTFHNKTHTWRKIYCSYSFILFDQYGNLNIWIMKVSGHMSISTSFAYADLTVVPHVILQDKNYSVVISRLETDNKKLISENEELLKSFRELQKNQLLILSRLSTITTKTTRSTTGELVLLPQIGGGEILVEKFPEEKFIRRFKPSHEEEKKEFTSTSEKEIYNRLLEARVDISSLTNDDFKKINVPRKIGRKVIQKSKDLKPK